MSKAEEDLRKKSKNSNRKKEEKNGN